VNYCYVRSIIKFAPFVDLIEGVEQLDHLYIDLPMGQIPLADDFLIEAWQERKRRDNTMTHMRGSPQDRGLSIEPWTTAALDNYISPEAVRAEVQRRNKVKKELWEEAKVAFDISAALRAQDIKPDKASVFGPSRQISLSASTPAAIETLSAVYGESNVMGTMITDHLPPESDDGEPPGVGVPGQDDGPG
jgi:hypothetical protein